MNSVKRPEAWPLAMSLLVFVCAMGVFVPGAAPAKTGGPINGADVAWMLTATALVLLMTPGLSFFYGGMVRGKNVVSTMLQSFVAMGLVSVLWVVVGFSLSFGESWHGLIGSPTSYFMFRGVGGATHPDLSPTIPLALFALFQLKFAIITPALTTGAFAERIRFPAYLLFLVLFSLFIYAPLAHWTWHPEGFLRKWGVLDFAGGTVVHMSSGFAALAGALFMGRRGGKPEAHAPAKIPYVLLGTGMLWFGWFGFNAGSALAANETAVTAFLTTNTASAAAMLAWLFLDTLRGRKPSATGACIGAVVGLVAITPAAGFVDVGSSLLIGALAATISNFAVSLVRRVGVDDALDVFPCHGLGGAVGMMLTAVFAKDVGLIAGKTALLGTHFLALAIVAAFPFGGAYLLYMFADRMIPMRVTDEDEKVGLDLSQHDERVGTVIVDGMEALPSEAT
jgi:Amt family ammonium transporter